MRGCFLYAPQIRKSRAGLPRACGGVSRSASRFLLSRMSSPRMRGCFLEPLCTYSQSWVFPAHAGVFPKPCSTKDLVKGLPRACGGVSNLPPYPRRYRWSSPRMRGCFRRTESHHSKDQVFPAHAGVFLCVFLWSGTVVCLPRACGGVSRPDLDPSTHHWSSPRMRGCFLSAALEECQEFVFPAHAGVFPKANLEQKKQQGLPRACGGVSTLTSIVETIGGSSPRMRGCF